jgi:uncharacterized protein YciI
MAEKGEGGKPQFIYILRLVDPTMLARGPTAAENAIVGRHFAHLQKLTQEGVMILVGRTQTTDPGTMGIAIFEAADERAAEAIMRSDPAIAEGLMTGELRPFQVALQRGESSRP